MLNDDISKTDLPDEQANAVLSRAKLLNVRLCDLNDVANKGGSGIKVKLGNKYFIATAEHVIADMDSPAIIQPQGKTNITKFLRQGSSKIYDVGFLEVSQADAAQLGDFQAEMDIIILFDNTKCWPAVIAGYPSVNHRVKNNTISFSEEGVASCLLPVNEWPRNLATPPDTERDIFFDYPDRMSSVVRGPRGLNRNNVCSPKPNGISGCGIWISEKGQSEAKIWFPRLCLVGIEHGFLSNLRMLRGTAIQHWLNLIKENYPDLAEVISNIRTNGVVNEK